MEGLHEPVLRAHYGLPGTDVGVTRCTLATLRDALTNAARSASDIDATYLLCLKPGSLPREVHAGAAAGRAAGEAPTLEAFRETVDPDAFYTERELVAMHVQTYPPVASPAVARLEASVVDAPQLEHTLDGWFDAKRVARLAAAGVANFAELLAPIRAQRITDFIAQHPAALGSQSPLALTPRRRPPGAAARAGRRRGAARGAARAGRAPAGGDRHARRAPLDGRLAATDRAVCDTAGLDGTVRKTGSWPLVSAAASGVSSSSWRRMKGRGIVRTRALRTSRRTSITDGIQPIPTHAFRARKRTIISGGSAIT
ncbi:hypothetical protein WI77_27045 [Burkholderia ubonensis]|uniref:phage integrase family protein n=1 Tax=Burkholderia ubonensis TaxID=101571 RepID=UPI00075A8E4E|nr:phage integrase family protein [Burkholderia ubonensis]KVD05534.1 hypothetical protein WI77_27045 [Burkholderia ubonensis]